MPPRKSDAFLNTAFVRRALKVLSNEGFISDKHAFVPNRDALQTHGLKIGAKLAARGFTGQLKTCFLWHERAGYMYFLYNGARYHHHDVACSAAVNWLDCSLDLKAHLKWGSQ